MNYYHTLGTDGESEAKDIAIGLQASLGYSSEIVQTARIEWVVQFSTSYQIEGEERQNLKEFAEEVDAELLLNFTGPCESWSSGPAEQPADDLASEKDPAEQLADDLAGFFQYAISYREMAQAFSEVLLKDAGSEERNKFIRRFTESMREYSLPKKKSKKRSQAS